MLRTAVVILQAFSVLSHGARAESFFRNPRDSEIGLRSQSDESKSNENGQLKLPRSYIFGDTFREEEIPESYNAYITVSSNDATMPYAKNCLNCLMPMFKSSNFTNVCNCLPCSMKIPGFNFEPAQALLVFMSHFNCRLDTNSKPQFSTMPPTRESDEEDSSSLVKGRTNKENDGVPQQNLRNPQSEFTKAIDDGPHYSNSKYGPTHWNPNSNRPSKGYPKHKHPTLHGSNEDHDIKGISHHNIDLQEAKTDGDGSNMLLSVPPSREAKGNAGKNMEDQRSDTNIGDELRSDANEDNQLDKTESGKEKIGKVFRKILRQMLEVNKDNQLIPEANERVRDDLKGSRELRSFAPQQRSLAKHRRKGLSMYEHSYARPSYQFHQQEPISLTSERDGETVLKFSDSDVSDQSSNRRETNYEAITDENKSRFDRQAHWSRGSEEKSDLKEPERRNILEEGSENKDSGVETDKKLFDKIEKKNSEENDGKRNDDKELKNTEKMSEPFSETQATSLADEYIANGNTTTKEATAETESDWKNLHRSDDHGSTTDPPNTTEALSASEPNLTTDSEDKKKSEKELLLRRDEDLEATTKIDDCISEREYDGNKKSESVANDSSSNKERSTDESGPVKENMKNSSDAPYSLRRSEGETELQKPSTDPSYRMYDSNQRVEDESRVNTSNLKSNLKRCRRNRAAHKPHDEHRIMMMDQENEEVKERFRHNQISENEGSIGYTTEGTTTDQKRVEESNRHNQMSENEGSSGYTTEGTTTDQKRVEESNRHNQMSENEGSSGYTTEGTTTDQKRVEESNRNNQMSENEGSSGYTTEGTTTIQKIEKVTENMKHGRVSLSSIDNLQQTITTEDHTTHGQDQSSPDSLMRTDGETKDIGSAKDEKTEKKESRIHKKQLEAITAVPTEFTIPEDYMHKSFKKREEPQEEPESKKSRNISQENGDGLVERIVDNSKHSGRDKTQIPTIRVLLKFDDNNKLEKFYNLLMRVLPNLAKPKSDNYVPPQRPNYLLPYFGSFHDDARIRPQYHIEHHNF